MSNFKPDLLFQAISEENVGEFRLKVNYSPKGDGSIEFEIYLNDSFGNFTQQPVFKGKLTAHKNIIVYIYYNDVAVLGSKKLELADTELERALFMIIGEKLQNESIILVDYSNLNDVKFELSHGAPPIVTRIGYALIIAEFIPPKNLDRYDCLSDVSNVIVGIKMDDDHLKNQRLRELVHEIDKFLVSQFPWPRTKERAYEVRYELLKMLAEITARKTD